MPTSPSPTHDRSDHPPMPKKHTRKVIMEIKKGAGVNRTLRRGPGRSRADQCRRTGANRIKVEMRCAADQKFEERSYQNQGFFPVRSRSTSKTDLSGSISQTFRHGVVRINFFNGVVRIRPKRLLSGSNSKLGALRINFWNVQKWVLSRSIL